MRGRERLLATSVIWIVTAIMLNMVITTFTRLNADFTGLWPNYSIVNWNDLTAMQQWEQAIQAAHTLSTQLMDQVTAAMTQQLSAQIAPMLVLTLAVLVAAVLSTFFIWRGAGAETENPAQASKAKRAPGRVSQMLETLSEDEVYELRARLLQDEDETLADLMTGQKNRRRSG